MRIIGVASSPRGTKSQTLRLLESVLDGARQAGAETELVDVCRMIHCQLLAGKHAASVSTAGGPACEEVTRYLDEILLQGSARTARQ